MDSDGTTVRVGAQKVNRMQKITPFLWFDKDAEAAVKHYVSVFKNSKIHAIVKYPEGTPGKAGTVMTVDYQLEGQQFTAINGGPEFTFSPAISFFVTCKTEQEVIDLHKKLNVGGTTMMPLDTYPFSKKYVWFNDKYGVSWQLFLGEGTQKITPALLFVGKQHGNAKAAIEFYTSIFKHSSIELLMPYEKSEDKPGIKHGRFTLEKQQFIAMDSGYDHKFSFKQAVSFLVTCETQEEIDYYWEKLTKGGTIIQCGWLSDKFGVPWQIVPTALGKMMINADPKTTQRIMGAVMKMKKLDLKKLQEAYNKK